jgi:aspartate racemase
VRGFRCLTPGRRELDDLVMPAIRKVKAGDLAGARLLLMEAIDLLGHRGANRIVMGCTEIPVALEGVGPDRLIDATEALACKCVQWWLERRPRLHSHHSEPAACL